MSPFMVFLGHYQMQILFACCNTNSRISFCHCLALYRSVWLLFGDVYSHLTSIEIVNCSNGLDIFRGQVSNTMVCFTEFELLR